MKEKFNANQNLIAVIGILAVLGVIYFLDDISNWWNMRNMANDPRPVLATVTKVTNDVKYRLPESLNYIKASEGLNLRSKDNISTESDSTAVVKFKNGLQIEVQPNSLLVVEDTSAQEGALELTFLRGEIKVMDQSGKSIKLNSETFNKKSLSFKTKQVGDETKLEIAGKEDAAKKELDALKDLGGEEMAAAPIQIDLGAIGRSMRGKDSAGRDISLDDKKESRKLAMISEKEMEGLKPKRTKIPSIKETLSDKSILNVIREKRAFLNRCYAQHLRLNPDARGRIITSLTIEPDGTISSARITNSTIADPTLQQCVITTLQRCRFKTFKGDPIALTYPINFD